MFFQCPDSDAGELRASSGQAPNPALIWAVRRGHWYVWAVKHGPYVPRTELFQAPYMNVWSSGEICTGNARLPRHFSPEVIAGFEQAFFESRFTHPNTNVLTAFDGGVYALWAAMLSAGDEPFPDDTLVPLNLTLGDVVRRLTKKD